MKGTTIFFLSILLITTGCKRLDQTADDLITVDVTNNSFPKKELARWKQTMILLIKGLCRL